MYIHLKIVDGIFYSCIVKKNETNLTFFIVFNYIVRNSCNLPNG